MTDELPPSMNLDVYEAVPLEMVEEALTHRATTGRKRSDRDHLRGAFRCVIVLIVLWVMFSLSMAWEMGLLPKFWLHEEWIPLIIHGN